jgi:hypothetical protein
MNQTERILQVIGPIVAKNFLEKMTLTPQQKHFLLKELEFAFSPEAPIDQSHIVKHAPKINQLFDEKTLLNIISPFYHSMSTYFNIGFEERPHYQDATSFKNAVDFQIKHDIFHSITIITIVLREIEKYCRK